MSQTRRETSIKDIYKSMIYGSIAGTAEVMVNHPFWTMKTRSQRKLPFSIQPRILYSGIIPNTMSMMPITAFQTAMFQAMKIIFFPDAAEMSSSQMITCAFMAGVGAASIAAPTELLMTVQDKHGSFYRAGHYVIKNSGWKGLYNGFMATALRDGIFTAGYLEGSPIAKSYIQPYVTNDFAAGLCAGFTAGIISSVTSQAIDTIKTEQQSSEVKQRIGIVTAAKKIKSSSGVIGFFNGGLFRGARIISAVTIMSMVNEKLTSKFG